MAVLHQKRAELGADHSNLRQNLDEKFRQVRAKGKWKEDEGPHQAEIQE